MQTRAHFIAAMLGLMLIIIGAFLIRYMDYSPDPSMNHRVTSVVGGSFVLAGPEGKSAGAGSWPGKLMVVTFGYRYCPDICPTNLGTIGAALEKLGPARRQRFQPLFITVDPERDTVEALQPYVQQFHPSFIGLGGTPAQIEAVAKTFKVYYKKVEGPTPEGYSIDHTSYIYVTDDKGDVIKVYGHDSTPDQLAEGFGLILASVDKKPGPVAPSH